MIDFTLGVGGAFMPETDYPSMREGRGTFELSIRHRRFAGGMIDGGYSERGGCVAYDQTRTYYLQSSGPGDEPSTFGISTCQTMKSATVGSS